MSAFDRTYNLPKCNVKNEDIESRILEDATPGKGPKVFREEYLAKRKKHLLQVEELRIEISDASGLLQGLSAEHLKSIHLRNPTEDQSLRLLYNYHYADSQQDCTNFCQDQDSMGFDWNLESGRLERSKRSLHH
ncbi:hypothetical protein L5515_000104 [Caenorhabditis briggsae]|uniref:Uncharacterized protein n=1 Tax=Caenorhabditis briggsae TaxID=6238 RepID=A0AAE9DXG5_CAEBR|nr:hypothetical protein L5515_000104 [Caenorhabditis briggsae]